MANLTFPSNPTNGQKVTVNDKVFVYNSTTSRWTATRLQIFGNLTGDFTIPPPELSLSNNTVAFDTTGQTVYITYTVDQDVKATIATNGIANSSYANVTLHQTNNTIQITAGTEDFSGANVVLTVTNTRTSNTASISLSQALPWTVDLNNVTYDSVSLTTQPSGETAGPFGLSFSNDGAEMYITGNSRDKAYQYSLSTPWDLSSATYTGELGVNANPYGCFINSDGTRLFVVNQGNILIEQYNLSTAYDVTSGSDAGTDFSVNGAPRDVTFSRDGTKLYVASQTPSAIYQYSLTTPWELSTANSTASSSMGAPALSWGIELNADGTKIYIGSISTDLLYRYDLSTPYDLSTASFDHSIDISSQVDQIKGIAFKYDDGSKMYLADATSDAVYQYSTGL